MQAPYDDTKCVICEKRPKAKGWEICLVCDELARAADKLDKVNLQSLEV